MWGAIGKFFQAWFGWATPQRADFELVVALHEKLSMRLHEELNDRDRRIDELEKREGEQAAEIRSLSARVNEVTKLQKECERRRASDRVVVERLQNEIKNLKGVT